MEKISAARKIRVEKLRLNIESGYLIQMNEKESIKISTLTNMIWSGCFCMVVFFMILTPDRVKKIMQSTSYSYLY